MLRDLRQTMQAYADLGRPGDIPPILVVIDPARVQERLQVIDVLLRECSE